MPRREQLEVTFPPIGGIYDAENNKWEQTQLYGLYKEETVGAATALYMETSIDLSGHMLDEDTVLRPRSYLIQDPGYYYTDTQGLYTESQGYIYTMEIVATRRLNMNDIITSMVYDRWPSDNFSEYDKQQIVIGEMRIWQPILPTYDALGNVSNTPGYCVLNRGGTFGYADLIGVDKLWCYRIVLPFCFNVDDEIVCPSLRIRIDVEVDHVDAKEFVYALKRNVELDGQVRATGFP